MFKVSQPINGTVRPRYCATERKAGCHLTGTDEKGLIVAHYRNGTAVRMEANCDAFGWYFMEEFNFWPVVIGAPILIILCCICICCIYRRPVKKNKEQA